MNTSTPMETYLKENYTDEIINLINDTNDRSHVSLLIDLSTIQQKRFDLFCNIIDDVQSESTKWNAALLEAQKQICEEQEAYLEPNNQIKVNCHVRFIGLPPPDPRYKLPFPNYSQIGQFREIRGNVIRMSQMKLLELKRDFVCSQCKQILTIDADYSLMYRFDAPRNCEKVGCKGQIYQKSQEPLPEYCVYYQELKVQDLASERNIPPTIVVTLDNDLVDSCQPGDCVTICGSIERRWTSFQYEGEVQAVVAMRAISVVREQHHMNVDMKYFSEQMALMQADWNECVRQHGELNMRDNILRSFCPEVYGMYPVKMAIALAICSGNFDMTDTSNTYQRGQSHVLMIGDPGLAKSKLLLSAVSVAPRAVHTTGMGCSSAGLTAAAVKEDGEWQLEAGALVLSDGGICCIDEFNLMRETDRTSIHEAMEQQTISLAKAGIVCKLNTRCAIIAAANPRSVYTMSESQGSSSLNVGIASPLLSRFDLVLILRDERVPEWDDIIAGHLLAQVRAGFAGFSIDKDTDVWDIQKMQTHFASVCHIKPQMTPEASHIISKYYQKCRADPQRDFGRTTVRMLDSLNRLAEAHARLVFRDTVRVTDAVAVIRLMESTHGFGRIIKPYDVVKEELPLGPSEDEVKEVCNALDPTFTLPIVSEKEEQAANQRVSQNAPISHGSSDDDLVPSGQTLLATSQNIPTQAIFPSSSVKSSHTVVSQTATGSAFENPSGLDEPSTHLESQSSSQARQQLTPLDASIVGTHSNEFDDDEDEILSQVLDNVELSQVQQMMAPPPKIPKLADQSRLTLSRDTISSSSTQKRSMVNSQQSEAAGNSRNEVGRKNRMFCTPASSISSQSSSLGTQNMEIDTGNNAKRNHSSMDTEDSAYQSGQTPLSRASAKTQMSKEHEMELLDCFD